MSATLARHWGERSFLQLPIRDDWHEPKKRAFGFIQSRPPQIQGVEVPPALAHVADAVKKSEYILQLADNWDDEGSPSYDAQTWNRAVKFVLKNAVSLWTKEYFKTDAPAIHNGPDGSIDIHWKSPVTELLVNIPADCQQPATYYGMNKLTGGETKGKLDTSAPNEWLLMWITAK